MSDHSIRTMLRAMASGAWRPTDDERRAAIAALLEDAECHEPDRWESTFEKIGKWDKLYAIRVEYEMRMGFRKWMSKLPFLKFDPEWEVKVNCPFGGAMIRFTVRKGEKSVSCYFDPHCMLGGGNEPYWEIYHGDAERFPFGRENEMMEAIRDALR